MTLYKCKCCGPKKGKTVSTSVGLILGEIQDTVARFLYYDRTEDEELPVGVIEEAVRNGDITVGEMVAAFRGALQRALN